MTRFESTPSTVSSPEDSVNVPAVLDLLEDAYTRMILRAVTRQRRSGADVAEVTPVTPSTAYRRLDRLADAGLVAVHHTVEEDTGHHSREYEAAFERLDIALSSGFVRIENT